jgi:phosphoserine phosphatase
MANFDLDETLIHGDCATLWSEQMGRLGWVDPNRSCARQRTDGRLRPGNLAMEDYMAFSLEPMIGRTRKRSSTWSAHGSKTSSNRSSSATPPKPSPSTASRRPHPGDFRLGHAPGAPIAERLGIDEILGIELEVAHGVYTGKTVGTLTYREGKITRLLEWLDAEEENLEGASFYSDSRNDCRCC